MKSALSVPVSTRKNLRYLVPFAVGLLSLAMIRPVLAQEQMTRTLTVTGDGTEMVPTTLSQVRLGVEVQGRTAEAVQQEAAQRSSAVVDLLRSRNVQRLQTTGITLSPNYSYDDGRQRLVGYIATNTVSFEIPTERTGSLLDDAVEAGATRIDGVSFIASDEAIAGAQRQALREATQEAQAQADAVLDVLGLTRRDVVGIQINGSTPPPPPMPLYRAEALQDAASTPVVGGEQEVRASVTLQISY
ncbi:SIMPL domain-containing protein [Oculatella sp. LEGE 06141]|uniref:SIMPL domain-containing protein n=1 Tax=Oculatella sp. LEGE 06141 TaxID=1828648 RepID=UPI00187FF8F3|nr:SIMPL domain-containing protein [Oculatella sp. LEGE 06141]MBE9177526.1 SIMPL domain-containing protein [Oculatella sp. LEGE 06141]